MALDVRAGRQLIAEILREAETGEFPSLRAVDAKGREMKIALRELGAASLAQEMDDDPDFQANSRRVRLEALANYCRMALRFLSSGALIGAPKIQPAPPLASITAIMPELDSIIRARWREAQLCQHAGAFLAAVILMGSILEALLLARCSMAPTVAYASRHAPRDRGGKALPIHSWNLSSLIDVSVDCGWLKTDRGGFSHALRQYRNVVHPYEHARTQADFDEATCSMCWQVLKASVDDLSRA